ncbi:MAG: ABC transporter ATP-binding protein [Syntrophomonadaceae bacterium]|nr:ABC transporter ATP-binding protein [Syntrophomonadaceae bacterium]
MLGGDRTIKMEHVSKSFGGLQVLNDFSYTFGQGEFVCICGPSGIGKTTILQLIAGLQQPDAGQMERASHNIGYVFQEPRLIPWCSVLENIETGLHHIMPEAKSERRHIAAEMAYRVGLEGFQDYFPAQLSGGMKQRVSLARAFAVEPDILLLDEPFSSLNIELREAMCGHLLQLLALKPCTTMMVTHTLEDAVRLADRMIYLHDRPCQITLEYRMDKPPPERDMQYIFEQMQDIGERLKLDKI